MTAPLLTARQVAARLNVTVAWFYRNRARLESLGFPHALPGFRQGRWDPQALDNWITEKSGKPPQEPAVATVEDLLARKKDLLRARAQQIAQRRASGSHGP